MPKGRMLMKKISYDERIAKLSLPASHLYTWCIPHLDVAGRIYGDASILKGQIVPYVTELTIDTIPRCIDEMESHGLVQKYGNGIKYLEFCGFSKNQTLRVDREGPSEIPPPIAFGKTSIAGVTPELIPHKIREDKLSKEKIREGNSSTSTPEYQAVIVKWNSTKLPNVISLSTARREKLKLRWKSQHFKENFEKAIDKLSRSSFAMGGKGWKASLDWFISNDTNYLKALEGKYDDKEEDRFSKY